MTKQPKPHFHILGAEDEVVAMVVTWEYGSRNVMFPCFFSVKGYAKAIGAWLSPVMEDLFNNKKPLYLLDHHGHEFKVDKDESEKGFFF